MLTYQPRAMTFGGMEQAQILLLQTPPNTSALAGDALAVVQMLVVFGLMILLSVPKELVVTKL